MAKARKCDICGKLYEEYNLSSDFNAVWTARVYTNDTYSLVKLIEICPNCMVSIQNLIANLKKESEPT